MEIIFVGAIGKPRLKIKKHLSRAWKNVNRIHSDKGISPAVTTDKRQYVLITSKIKHNKNMKILRVTGNNKKTRKLVETKEISALKASNQANPKSGGTSLVLVTPKNNNKRMGIKENKNTKKFHKGNKTKSKPLTYFSAFSGIAGFEIPMQELGLECVGYSEIDKYACQVYERHFPTHKNFGDITEIKASELPDFDMLVGGIPCQSWSIAGKRGGFNDERGNMWFECFRILKAKKPKFFLFENVKGLLSHDGGKSMERICEELCECEYAIDFEILNSKNFGVAQSRERVFIIGTRLDLLDKCQLF